MVAIPSPAVRCTTGSSSARMARRSRAPRSTSARGSCSRACPTRSPAIEPVIDLACGTGVSGAWLGVRHPELRVYATDQSAAAVASARATAEANGVAERMTVVRDDGALAAARCQRGVHRAEPAVPRRRRHPRGCRAAPVRGGRPRAPPGRRAVDGVELGAVLSLGAGADRRTDASDRAQRQVHRDRLHEGG